jgi:hypothetical protein
MESLLDKRDNLQRNLEANRTRRGELEQRIKGAEAALEGWKKVIAERIANRDHGSDGDRKDMQNILAHNAALLEGYKKDLASTQKVLANQEGELDVWNKKHGATAAKLEGWKKIQADGKYGTSSEQLNKKAPITPKDATVSSVSEGGNVTPLRTGEAARVAAERVARRRGGSETASTGAESTSNVWDRVGAMIEEALMNMPERLQNMLKKFSGRVQTAAPPAEILMNAWNDLEKEKPPLHHTIKPNKIKGIEKMTLVQFGEMLHKDGVEGEVVMQGIERIATAWDKQVKKGIDTIKAAA